VYAKQTGKGAGRDAGLTDESPKNGSENPPLRAANRALAREQCYTLSFEQHLGGASVPLYEYKCLKCGRNTEKIETVAGPHLKKCPHCWGKVESVITAPSIQFKGAGWYVTDYGGKKPGASSGDGEKTDKSAGETKESGSKDKDSGSKEATSKETKKSEEKKPAKKSSSSEK
jgi:putative FmdB family regulatory protein